MKWKIFSQIILLIVILTIALHFILPIDRLLNSGLYPFRYEFIPAINEKVSITLENGEVVYLPDVYSAVFDKWTGKIYKNLDFLEPRIIMEDDYINGKGKLLQWHTNDTKIKFDYKKMQTKIEGLLKQQQKSELMDIYKAVK